MNKGRIVLGGVVGGIVYSLVAMAIDFGVLMGRYESLASAGRLRTEPRLPFMVLFPLVLIVVSIGLVWLYAAARTRLGPGPKTALLVGLVAGVICALPGNFSTFSWSYMGGTITLWWTIEAVLGSMLATLAGAWLYKE